MFAACKIFIAVTVSYRLRAPLLALKRDGSACPNLRTLPAGVLVTLASDVRESGLVDIVCGDDHYTAFYEDLAQRAEMEPAD